MNEVVVKPRLFRLSYFMWVVVPLALFLASERYGLPQLRWSYSWIDQGQGYDPRATRYYTRCTYIGSNGETTIYPIDGRCSWFHFYNTDRGSHSS